MVLVKNCIIVLVFALFVVSMIVFGVRTIEAKENTASFLPTQAHEIEVYEL